MKDDTIVMLGVVTIGGILVYKFLGEGIRNTGQGIGAIAQGAGQVSQGVGTAVQGVGQGISDVGTSVGNVAKSTADAYEDVTSVTNPLKAITDKTSAEINSIPVPTRADYVQVASAIGRMGQDAGGSIKNWFGYMFAGTGNYNSDKSSATSKTTSHTPQIDYVTPLQNLLNSGQIPTGSNNANKAESTTKSPTNITKPKNNPAKVATKPGSRVIVTSGGIGKSNVTFKRA